MFNTNNGYSLADIAAATGANGNNSGWGNGDSWWIILLLLLAGWGNGNGFGGNGATMKEEIAYGFDMNGLENSVRGIQQGLCDGFYSMNNSLLTGFNGAQNTMAQGFAGINTAIAGSTADIQQGMTALNIAGMQNTNALTAQLSGMAADNAACCCATQRAIDAAFADLNYNLATQSCATQRVVGDAARDIIENQNANTRSILDFLTQDKIATLTAENQSLKFAASQSAQNAYLVGQLKEPCAVPAYVVPNPNCCYPPANFCGAGAY